ncbi:dihydroneopterin aldolase [Pedobacter sp. BS3]|uniref:dihydroneopterin aldolase n=1 Tax=Pedobacter sp. BS3 TaxID=2567937 RepID=UPI0011F029DB|nr:dihydroneopterin aldolase [Pedobacter sp. BS3]TZF84843.1 dihydroneopterin aldolase [Pedobacter sp. BS3]
MGTLRCKVALEAIRFFAYHGYYPEEQLTGNEFLVDIEVVQPVFSAATDDLAQTVNYERLLEIATTRMKQTVKLLETVAHAILEDIKTEFMAVDYIKVRIRKSNLPVAAELKNALIELVYER